MEKTPKLSSVFIGLIYTRTLVQAQAQAQVWKVRAQSSIYVRMHPIAAVIAGADKINKTNGIVIQKTPEIFGLFVGIRA